MTDTALHSFKSNQAQEQSQVVPAVLTVLVHLALLGILYFGMTLQIQKPTEVEIWDGAGLAAANHAATSPSEAAASTISPPPAQPSTETSTQPTAQTAIPNKTAPLAVEPVQAKPEPVDINTPSIPKKTVEKATPVAPVATTAPEKVKTTPKTESKPSASQAITSIDSAARAAALGRLKANSTDSTSNGNNENIGEYLSDVKSRIKKQTGTRVDWSTLNARIHIKINPNGSIRIDSFPRKSGRAEWDDALIKALKNTILRIPVPNALKNAGTDVTFKP